jgi:hypothetical protein
MPPEKMTSGQRGDAHGSAEVMLMHAEYLPAELAMLLARFADDVAEAGGLAPGTRVPPAEEVRPLSAANGHELAVLDDAAASLERAGKFMEDPRLPELLAGFRAALGAEAGR